MQGVMNIQDAVSPASITIAKVIGYGVIAIAWAVIVALGFRLYCEATTTSARIRRPHA